MAHIVLLGDSIFDNLRYVQPGPDVLAQLRAMLPAGWNASLRAVDGAVINNVEEQLAEHLQTPRTWCLVSAETIYLAMAESCSASRWRQVRRYFFFWREWQ